MNSKMMPPKQLLTTLLIVFSTLSLIKFLLLTNSSSSSASYTPNRGRWTWGTDNATAAAKNGADAKNDLLADKELALLRSVVATRAPCRLLVFGLTPQLLVLASLNAGPGAATSFVTDDAEAADDLAAFGAAIHRVAYAFAAGEAWALLRRARESPACRRPTGTLQKSSCGLALTSLPREVLDGMWDVIVVDGPNGAGPGEPGRMGAIYTAAALARATTTGAAVDVAVHDVHRTVERWYAWEYLCEENLVAAKGRLWHFRVKAGPGSNEFCSPSSVQIL